MTARWNDTRCGSNASSSVPCLAQLSVRQMDPADEPFTNAYLITNVTGGALFYADGVTLNAEGVGPASNASEGLRFLNARDLNDENFFELGEDGLEDKPPGAVRVRRLAQRDVRPARRRVFARVRNRARGSGERPPGSEPPRWSTGWTACTSWTRQ